MPESPNAQKVCCACGTSWSWDGPDACPECPSKAIVMPREVVAQAVAEADEWESPPIVAERILDSLRDEGWEVVRGRHACPDCSQPLRLNDTADAYTCGRHTWRFGRRVND